MTACIETEHTHDWIFISNVSSHRHGLAWQMKEGMYTYWCPSCGALQQVYNKREGNGIKDDVTDTYYPTGEVKE